ncbi:MAG: Fe-S protein assembly co-chaperone HscB [Acidobacteria bacterium]|nr:Fe-S protein assembly co-chaperone HscB [Acidobacteriota bacterium]
MSTANTQKGIEFACWSCHGPIEGDHFCTACGHIQPLPRSADYFAFFGLPPKLRINVDDLEARFLKLSWKLHPDNFVRATENERDLSLDRSSQLNDAYRTLRDPIARVEYLLLQAGVRKEGQTKQQAPPELLEEVFELNESLDELRQARESEDSAQATELKSRLQSAEKNFEGKMASVDAELDAAFGQWDAAVDGHANEDERKKLMARMNEILNRRSYIRNLVNGVQKELAEN